MKRSTVICLAILGGLSFGLTALGGYCHTLYHVHRARERPYEVWMAALKGFEGPVFYVGNDGEFSYFRAGKFIYTPYKARTTKIRLPRTFPFGAQAPYRITEEMVPYYDPTEP